MNTKNNKQSNKTTIYNLIILDESGSMGCIVNQTISGCNETINTIKALQEEYQETQQHYIDIYAFQSDFRISRYLIKNESPTTVKHITANDYRPGGMTNLYDAIGATISDIKNRTKQDPKAIGSVTIITDGMENASTEYTHHQLVKMIDELKEKGWNFNFIGANIDVEQTAHSLNIDNHMSFVQDCEHTNAMWAHERRSRKRYFEKMNNLFHDNSLSEEVYREKMREISKSYFNPDEE